LARPRAGHCQRPQHPEIFILLLSRFPGLELGETFLDLLQLRLQEIGLVLERLFLKIRGGLLIRRRIPWIWRRIPSGTNPTWKSGGVKPIPPPAAAATAAETHPEPTSGDGVHISRHSKTSAVSGCASAHWSHSQWACPVSSWHDFPPFMSNRLFYLPPLLPKPRPRP